MLQTNNSSWLSVQEKVRLPSLALTIITKSCSGLTQGASGWIRDCGGLHGYQSPNRGQYRYERDRKTNVFIREIYIHSSPFRFLFLLLVTNQLAFII
jgi:hypothetical protein